MSSSQRKEPNGGSSQLPDYDQKAEEIFLDRENYTSGQIEELVFAIYTAEYLSKKKSITEEDIEDARQYAVKKIVELNNKHPAEYPSLNY